MKWNGMRVAVLGGMTALACSGMAIAQGSRTFSSQDKMFLAKSAEGSMTEIKLSQMALTKSNSDDVKAYAQKMIDDHNKLLSDMKPFADQAGVKPPSKLSPEHQMAAKKLSALSGDAFDKQYMMDMSKDHHKTLDLFKAEESSTNNTDLKAAVSQGEQVVQQHTDMADQMVQKQGGTPATGY